MFQVEFTVCRAQSQKENEGRREGETESVKWEVREEWDPGDVTELFTHLGSCQEPPPLQCEVQGEEWWEVKLEQ